MNDNDYFYESISDGIVNAIMALDETIDCSNQDGYELLVGTFGSSFTPDELRNSELESYEKFAENMQELFELEKQPTIADAKWIISRALKQWGGT
jgi:hypothetical protein